MPLLIIEPRLFSHESSALPSDPSHLFKLWLFPFLFMYSVVWSLLAQVLFLIRVLAYNLYDLFYYFLRLCYLFDGLSFTFFCLLVSIINFNIIFGFFNMFICCGNLIVGKCVTLAILVSLGNLASQIESLTFQIPSQICLIQIPLSKFYCWLGFWVFYN